eukprot:4771645-Pyramimonas_sp.AAC.1
MGKQKETFCESYGTSATEPTRRSPMKCGLSCRNEPESGGGTVAGAAEADDNDEPVQEGTAVGAVPEADMTQEWFLQRA